MIEDKNVVAIQCSNTQDEQYALFCDDKGLYHGNDADGFVLLAILENINSRDRFIKIYYHFPFVCVTERYGLHAAVVNVVDRHTLNLSREDYHSDVSSYSIGFLERDGRMLLIHQTQWNRLDITDLETGEMLTTREVIYKKTEETEQINNRTYPKFEKKNYIDFFHSLLHVSPDGKHFLSNGWVWQPVDNIICFETGSFFNEYETCGKHIEYWRGYAWDRPCAFVGNDMIVIAADKDNIITAEGVDENKLKAPPAYHQLLFYKISEIKAGIYTYSGYENYDTLPLAYSCKADCDVFTFDEYGEITSGEIHYVHETERLVVLSQKGAFELTLTGEIVHSNPEIKQSVKNWDIRRNDTQSIKHTDLLHNWQFDIIRHSFYRYNENKIEKGFFINL